MTDTIREYTSLRVANIERQEMWCPDQKPDLSFRGCEIAGEVGELCELLIDDRIMQIDEAKLAEEIGDCFISLDLMGICVGLPPLPDCGKLPNGVYSDQLAGHLGYRVGVLCNIAKKLERERHGWRGSRATLDELQAAMVDVARVTNTVAIRWGIDVEQAVADKFNATSMKVDLPHRLVARAAA